VIDLSVCTPSLLNRIHAWAVSEEASMSDHRHILFHFETAHAGTVQVYRNPKAANWDLCREELDARCRDISRSLRSTNEVDLAVNHMTEVAIEAFHISCPIRGKPRDAKKPVVE